MHRLRSAARTTAVGFSVLAVQVIRAAHRPDIPSLTNQDPSGTFGAPDAPRLRIALLGDSSVTAPGVEPLDHAWPRRIAVRLADRYRVELVSVAVGGSKARDVLTQQIDRAVALAPDLALVSVGANDALRGTPVRRFETEMTEILAGLSAAVPGVGVSGIGDLGTLPRLPTFVRGVARVRGRAFDRAIARAAHGRPRVVKGAAWGDAWRIFAEGDPAEVFAADLFHASGVGHAVFAEACVPIMDELLRRLDTDPVAWAPLGASAGRDPDADVSEQSVTTDLDTVGAATRRRGSIAVGRGSGRQTDDAGLEVTSAYVETSAYVDQAGDDPAP